jgi:YHS domain-containing protein
MKMMLALILAVSMGVGAGVPQAAPTRAVPMCGAQAKTGAPKSFATKPAVGTKATCAVMGSEFTVKADTPMSQYKGRWYPFCCGECKPRFDKNPAQYAR